jgi:hypothetical protein
MAVLNEFEIFAPFQKIDERTGQFEAWATLEEVDAANEIIDIDKSFPYFQALADQFSKNTGGVNFGPLREQHDPTRASGHLIAPPVVKTREDGTRGIFISGVPTDPVTKDKMIRKTLTGISIGGSYVGAKEDVIINGRAAKKFVANPNHYAPVDSPCVKGALVTMIKVDGSEVQEPLRKEMAQFWDCGNDPLHRHLKKADAETCDAEPVAKAEADGAAIIAKAASEDFALPDGRYDISTKSKGKTAMRDVVVYGTAAEQKKVKAAVIAKYPELGTATAGAAAKSVTSEFQKSLWNVATLAGILSQLLCVASDEEWEETWEAIDSMKEGDPTDDAGMKVVGRLKAICQSVFDALEAMLQEERAEIDDAVFGEFAMAAIAGTLSKSPTAKQLIKSLRVLKGNGSTANAEHKETAMSTTAAPVVTPKEETPAPETVAKALACNDPINPHMHEGGVCKAEKIDATVAPVLKAISSLSTKFDEQTAKRTEDMTKVAELETAVDKLAKGVAFLMNLPAAPQGALRETAAISKAEDAAPAPEPAAVKPAVTAPVVRKYEDTGHASSVELMKTIVGGGLQNIEAPVRGASA